MSPVISRIQESTDTQWVLIGHSLGGVSVGKVRSQVVTVLKTKDIRQLIPFVCFSKQLVRVLKDHDLLSKLAGLVFLASFPNAADLVGECTHFTSSVVQPR